MLFYLIIYVLIYFYMLRLFDPVVSDKRQTINNGRSHQSYEFDASPLADRGTLEQSNNNNPPHGFLFEIADLLPRPNPTEINACLNEERRPSTKDVGRRRDEVS